MRRQAMAGFERGLRVFGSVICLAVGLAGCATVEPAIAPVRNVAVHSPVAPRLAEPRQLPPHVTLIGMSSGDLEAMLGRPSLQRRESNAQYWRYNFVGCVLDVYVYRNRDLGRDQVTHFELRSPWNGAVPAALDSHCSELAHRLEASKTRPAGKTVGGELPRTENH